MALKSKNMHYHWHNIQRSHFLQAAKNANYSVEKAEVILDEMLKKVDLVITQLSDELPKGFPKRISQPIFDGMQKMKRKLQK